MLAQQSRLEREASGLAGDAGLAAAMVDATSSELASFGVPNALSNRFDYVAISGPRGEYVYSSRISDWTILQSPELTAAVAQGVTKGGLAVAADGTPVIFAAVPVRIPSSSFAVIVVGEPVKSVDLETTVRSLDLTMELRTSRGGSVSSQELAPDRPDSVRTFVYPAAVSEFSMGEAEIDVVLSTAPLERATASAAMTSAVVACAMALSLLLLVGFLLDRSVVRPLRQLRAGLSEVEEGRYDKQLRSGGVREFAEVAAGFQRMATMVGRQQAHLRHQAARDSLTGLANHATFYAALQDAVAHEVAAEDPAVPAGTDHPVQGQLAVIVLDVDHFKEINDEHGHPFGDEVLRTVADQLSKAVRETDVAARLGGDEFALMMRLPDSAAVVEAAARICSDLQQVPVGAAHLAVSVGAACFPQHALRPDTLIEMADRALYLAKRSGRGRACHADDLTDTLDDAMTDAAPRSARSSDERHQIVELLARPVAVLPVFQPMVDLRTGAVVGYEALARFPGVEELSPEVWFDRAHRHGLGAQLEARAVEAALAVPKRPDGLLAVNVSPRALLTADVRAALAGSLAGVVVEVTERETLPDAGSLQRCLDDLRARGALVALDDTGAGYAGLSTLLCVRPDIIKLDRSLTRGVLDDEHSQAMVEALVRYARQTRALVVAEGIETLAQVTVLAEAGVDYGQGYALARPAAPWTPLLPDAAAFLRSENPMTTGLPLTAQAR